MKVLVLSDPHVHPHKGSNQRLEDCLRVLDWACQTALERGIKEIHLLGDLFQDRQKIQVYTYQKVFDIFRKYSGDLEWKILLGNHDLWFAEKVDVSSVFPLNAIGGVTVISQPTSMEIGGRWFDWLPFTKNPLKSIEDFKDEKGDRVFYGHIALDGCLLHSFGHTSDVSVEHEGDMVKVAPSHFNQWAKVFLGHYHAAQHVTDTIEYVGSPLQLNFSEAHQTKHILVLDTDDLSVEYIENTFSPKHLILREDQLDGVDLLNNYVWIIGDLTQFDAFEMNRKLEDKQMRKLEFRAKKIHEEIGDAGDKDVSQSKFNVTDGKTLEKYVEAVGSGNLDRSRLLQVGASICEEEKR